MSKQTRRDAVLFFGAFLIIELAVAGLIAKVCDAADSVEAAGQKGYCDELNVAELMAPLSHPSVLSQ
jgi:hypothetical protein